MRNRIALLNIFIDDLSEKELLNELSKGVLITPNVDHLIKLQQDVDLYNIYKKAEYVILDSRVIYYLLKIIGKAPRTVIPGSELFPKFYNLHKDNPSVKIFLLGGKPGVGEKARERINNKTSSNIIAGTYSPPFGFENSSEETKKIIKIIKDSGANVVAVCLGAPKQEKWIYNNKDLLKEVNLFLAIGATIDFEAGIIERAPVFMRKIGFEWFYRFIKEPKRLGRRYFVEDSAIFLLLIKNVFGIYKNPFEEEHEVITRRKKSMINELSNSGEK